MVFLVYGLFLEAKTANHITGSQCIYLSHTFVLPCLWATGIRRFCQEGRHHERSAFEEGQVLLLSGHRCGLCELLVNLSGAPLRQWNTVVYLRGEVNCPFLKWTSKMNTILVFELILFQRFESLFSFRKMSSLVILGPVRFSGIKL